MHIRTHFQNRLVHTNVLQLGKKPGTNYYQLKSYNVENPTSSLKTCMVQINIINHIVTAIPLSLDVRHPLWMLDPTHCMLDLWPLPSDENATPLLTKISSPM